VVGYTWNRKEDLRRVTSKISTKYAGLCGRDGRSKPERQYRYGFRESSSRQCRRGVDADEDLGCSCRPKVCQTVGKMPSGSVYGRNTKPATA
jgi:hypothetical protein